MPEPTQQPKPQPYQIMLNGCAIGCFCMVLAAFLFIGAVTIAAFYAPHTDTTRKEQPDGE